MSHSSIRSLCLGVVAVCAVATSVSAQTTTGSIRGQARDADGADLPGVTVTLLTGRGEERTTTTGPEGRFLISSVPAGVYSLRAELAGMTPQVVDGVRVTIAGTATVSFVLASTTFTGEVVVAGETPVIDLVSSTFSTNYDFEFVEDLPTRRQFWDLVALSPGMSSSSEWSSSQTAFGSGTS